MSWRSIASLPAWEFVELYSPSWACTAKGKVTQGLVIGCYSPATVTRPAEFIDAVHGLVLDSEFTLWRPLSPPVKTDKPPLTGEWRWNNGLLISGGVRVARDDFDGTPALIFKESLASWVCSTLNKAVEAWRQEGR